MRLKVEVWWRLGNEWRSWNEAESGGVVEAWE